MNDIVIRPAYREDFEIISKLIADQNKHPATHCIQSDTSEDYQGIQRELASLDLSSALRCVVALQADRLIGTMGCELDEELGRGWMRGPFIVADVGAWDTLAAALLAELSALLPPVIHWLDSFLNIANTRGNAFYHSQGFRQLRLVHVYVAAAPARPLTPTGPCSTLQPQQAQGFINLHQAIFPQTYATGQRILDQIDDNHRVFVYAPKDEVLGYLYAALENNSADGAIEFVGVRADARGQGIGRQLLQMAVQWLFEVRHVPQITLVVNDNLTNARALYESVGFRLKYTGVHARQER